MLSSSLRRDRLNRMPLIKQINRINRSGLSIAGRYAPCGFEQANVMEPRPHRSDAQNPKCRVSPQARTVRKEHEQHARYSTRQGIALIHSFLKLSVARHSALEMLVVSSPIRPMCDQTSGRRNFRGDFPCIGRMMSNTWLGSASTARCAGCRRYDFDDIAWLQGQTDSAHQARPRSKGLADRPPAIATRCRRLKVTGSKADAIDIFGSRRAGCLSVSATFGSTVTHVSQQFAARNPLPADLKPTMRRARGRFVARRSSRELVSLTQLRTTDAARRCCGRVDRSRVLVMGA